MPKHCGLYDNYYDHYINSDQWPYPKRSALESQKATGEARLFDPWGWEEESPGRFVPRHQSFVIRTNDP